MPSTAATWPGAHSGDSRAENSGPTFDEAMAPVVLRALHQLSVLDLPRVGGRQGARLDTTFVAWGRLGAGQRGEVRAFFDSLAIEVRGRVLEVARSQTQTAGITDDGGAACPFGLGPRACDK